MTSYTRTQVYLDPDDHRRLRRLAAERGHSMTDLVREAVARYVADELDESVPTMEAMLERLYADERYDGIAPGAAGFVDRMRARAAADDVPDALEPVDSDLGIALANQHDAHRAAWLRRGDDAPGADA